MHPRQRRVPAEHLNFTQHHQANADVMAASERASYCDAKRCYVVNGPLRSHMTVVIDITPCLFWYDDCGLAVTIVVKVDMVLFVRPIFRRELCFHVLVYNVALLDLFGSFFFSSECFSFVVHWVRLSCDYGCILGGLGQVR